MLVQHVTYIGPVGQGSSSFENSSGSGSGSSSGVASLVELKPFLENVWQNGSTSYYSLHPTIQGPLGNLKKPDMQGLFWFFLRSDASGIGVAVIHGTHASGMKAHAESNQIRNKHWLFFPKKN